MESGRTLPTEASLTLGSHSSLSHVRPSYDFVAGPVTLHAHMVAPAFWMMHYGDE
jgi:hypothetical protein